MIKFIKKQLDIEVIKTALAFAAIYCILFNTSVILHKYQYFQASFFVGILELMKQYVYIYISTFVFFCGLLIHRIIFIIGSLLLFITGAAASYYLFYFDISPSQNMMPAIFGTNSAEVSELISGKLIIWIVFSLSIFIFSIKYFNPQTSNSFFSRILTVVCLFLAISSIYSPRFSILKEYFPVQYLHNTYVYFFGNEDKNYKDISKEYKFKQTSGEQTEPIVGVLVIGESARYSNFGINGYERDTTPNLSKIDNLFSFKAHSCANVTYLSVLCMLSRHNEKNQMFAKSETGLLSVLTSLGYDTSWISTQTLTQYYQNHQNILYDEVNVSIIPGGSMLYKMNDHDSKMLPYIQKRIQGNEKKFLAIQLSGSHWNYASRYPEEFRKFTPVQDKYAKVDQASCTRQQLVNSYDNSILYTDFVLANLIDSLKDKNAFLVFVSDHAESLGEEGRLGHGAEFAPEQYEIPFIFWFSDSFKKNHPDLVRALNSHKSKLISHDYVFHTILNCLGIESEIIDVNYSLCRYRSIDSDIGT